MSLWLAQIIVGLVASYVCAGLLFALWFCAFGLSRLDAAAHDASLGLRLLWLPGVVAFWPWLAWRAYQVRQ